MTDFTGKINVRNSDSDDITIVLDGGDDDGGGALTLGAVGEDGDLVLKDSSGRQRIFLNGSLSEARFQLENGNISINIDGGQGTINLGASGQRGLLTLRNGNGSQTALIDGSTANIRLGGSGADGDILLFGPEGDSSDDAEATIHLKGDQGDIVLRNADCAEEFNVAGPPVDPGTVMVLDAGERLRPSTGAYDRRVAGVISGAGAYRPGLVLDRRTELSGRQPLAVVGKVFCNVDARFGGIQAGDLLTTSETPGHAMKVADPALAFGAVIGKALRSHEARTGLIPILVGLQ